MKKFTPGIYVYTGFFRKSLEPCGLHAWKLFHHKTKRCQLRAEMWPGTVKHCNGSVFIKETKEPSTPCSLPFLIPAGAGIVLWLWRDVFLWTLVVRSVSTLETPVTSKIGNALLEEFLAVCLQHHRRKFNQSYRKRL